MPSVLSTRHAAATARRSRRRSGGRGDRVPGIHLARHCPVRGTLLRPHIWRCTKTHPTGAYPNKERPARETCNLSSFLAVDPTVRSVIGRVHTADVHTPTDVKLKCKTVKYNRRC